MRITFRLNEEIDEDIISQIERVPKRDRSRTCREALRAFFGQSSVFISKELQKAPQLSLRLSEDDKKEKEIDLDDGLDKILSFYE